MLFHWIPYSNLTNQYTGYSINLGGGRITLLAMAFPFNLINFMIVSDPINFCAVRRKNA